MTEIGYQMQRHVGRRRRGWLVATVLMLVSHAVPAHAYIGPGLGIGVLTGILGSLVALGMIVFGVVWYPIKKMFRRLFGRKQ